MEEKLRIKTPTIEGTVNYGEFMEGDGRKFKFHCWINGGSIGGNSKTLEEAELFLREYLRECLEIDLYNLEEKTADIRLFLRSL